ncbi:PAAR domain-containing protein [Mixta intestinalis]|uniref:NAD(+)--protein-arginine ADP-ribosyltransferase n=1 Tax=Mixta intestinalis TaxID=1615494 RepID=A0A6P1PXA7_9GAMM|nr:PAAR domain-containing protein [Mixta intestinalis]QHM70499.1 putative deoxyribonuclease RhsA [Mixta intestinalis]
MSEFNAAREQDEIAHTASEGWLIAGAIGGALVAGAAIVVTGGTALVAVSAVAAGACTGGGLGELLGSMSWAPRHTTGQLASGSPDVYINDRPAIRAHLSTGACDEHSGSPQRVAEGSIKVFINNYPAARIGDRLTCSAEIFSGSPDVFIGGDKIQTDEISPEIPEWINWAMLGIGGAALVVLASPAIAVLGTLGGMGGGYAGSYLGGKLFGEGSDGQKWMMLAGSLVGGAAGSKGGMKFDAWRSNKTAAIPPKSTMSLADAVGKDRASRWINRGRELADQYNPTISALLSDDQVGALHGYTTEAGYKMINPALRGVKPLTPELEAFANHAVEGMNKLPVFEGETFRGIDTLPAEVLDAYQPGNIVADKAFMSTDIIEPFKGNIILNIEGKSGKNIHFLSAFKSTETEVLYPPGTKFEVVNRIEENGSIIIQLKEIE